MELDDITRFQLKRENPFEGLVIDAETWRDAHQYHRDSQRLHVLTFHRTGIVGGLEVAASDPPSLTVIIQPGIGIDPQGNTIVIADTQKYKIQARKKGTIYLVILFREIPGGPFQPAEGGQPTRIVEGYRIEERSELPPEPHLELARIDFDPENDAIREPQTPSKPGKNEIDYRFRQSAAAVAPAAQAAVPAPQQQAAPPPSNTDKPKPASEPPARNRTTLTIGHAVLGDAGKDLHLKGLQNLAREINQRYDMEIKIEKASSLAKNLGKYQVLYLTGNGNFELSDEEQSSLSKFVESGGMVFGEGCSEGEAQSRGAKEFGLAFNKIAGQFKSKLENVQRGHPLLSSAHIFSSVPQGAGPGMLLEGGRMVYSGSDYGCAWQGGYQDVPLEREVIRTAIEMAVNIMSYR
ncbi:MAG: DUF4159 domain-containing protein [Dehalococcoidia bacterium]